MAAQPDHIGQAHVELPSETEVRVIRDFHAPRELVYRAYTTPQLLQRWLLGPPGWTMPVCEMDLRVGGKYRWRWRNEAEGQEFGFYGKYVEVDPPRRIVHTEYFDPGDVGGDMGDGSMITIEFTETGHGTRLTTTMKFSSREARDAAMSTGMTDGMEMGYVRLDALLPEVAS